MWFSDYLALCGSLSPLGRIVLISDLSISAAYFAIPIGLLIVWSKRLDDLPYPWMFGLFAAFIVTCGLTHLIHALQMPFTTFEHTRTEATVKVICALLSIGTAVALIAIMPKALKLVSARERRLELERLVALRTRENTELVREMNHRMGNQLQVMSSIVRIERRRSRAAGELDLLDRVKNVLEGLTKSYLDMKANYSGVDSEDGARISGGMAEAAADEPVIGASSDQKAGRAG